MGTIEESCICFTRSTWCQWMMLGFHISFGTCSNTWMENNKCRTFIRPKYTIHPAHTLTSPPLISLSLYSSSTMSPRHFVTVPDSDTEIVEQVTYRRRTKRGIKTTYKQVLSEETPPEKVEKASRSRSRTQRQTKLRSERQTVPRDAEPTQLEPNNIGDMETHEFLDGEEDDLPDNSPGGVQPQPTVWSYTFCCNYISNESQSTMSQWLQYRDRYLDILLEMEGRPSSPPCSICSARCADIKCSDCCGANIFCKVCCLNMHKRSPFHRPLHWTGSNYVPTSLYSLGYLLCLGHDGEPCPKTVEVRSYWIFAQLIGLMLILGSEGIKEASDQGYSFLITPIGAGG